MGCERIQERLLGDYFDGRCSPASRKQVDEHLSGCPACREFLTHLEESSRRPFKTAPGLVPPESVWRNIRTEITANKKINLKDKWDYFFYGIIRFFTLPKLAAAGVTFALIVGMMTFSGKRIVRRNQEAGESIYEAAQLLSSLDSDSGDESDVVLNEQPDNFI